MKILVFLLLPCLSLSEVGNNFNNCKKFFLKDSPPQIAAPLSNAVKHICQCVWDDYGQKLYLYATLYSTAWRIPIYSAYVFGSASTGRCDPWYIEPQLDGVDDPCMGPQGRNQAIGVKQALNRDYDKSHYDRGHLYPVQHTDNHISMLATSTLTNAAPQDPDFNQNAWKVHEAAVITDLSTCDKAYVVTGVIPDFNKQIPINNPRVTVSKYYWRATCCLKKGKFTGKGYYGPDDKGEVQPLSITALQTALAFEYDVKNVNIFPGGCN